MKEDLVRLGGEKSVIGILTTGDGDQRPKLGVCCRTSGLRIVSARID